MFYHRLQSLRSPVSNWGGGDGVEVAHVRFAGYVHLVKVTDTG
jgi:hypothetical protein